METMTEKEAMEIIDFWRDLYKPKKAQEALEMAITALKEVQQYREIGTVEECKAMASIISKAETNGLAKIIDEWLSYKKIGTVAQFRMARISGYAEGYAKGYDDGYALGITQPI